MCRENTHALLVKSLDDFRVHHLILVHLSDFRRYDFICESPHWSDQNPAATLKLYAVPYLILGAVALRR